MLIIYRKICDVCDRRNKTSEDINNLTSDNIGETFYEGCLAYINHAGELITLSHPMESHILAKHGETWSSALNNGRIVSIRNIVCLDCGEINKKPTFFYQSTSLMGLLLMIGVLFIQIFYFKSQGIIGFSVLIILIAFLSFFIPWLYVRIRHADRLGPFKFKGCHKCGSKRYMSIRRCSNRKKFPCPRCGGKTATIHKCGSLT
jgi:hypothetical protein